MVSQYQNIISQLPYSAPFLFVDELTHVDDDSSTGSFTFSKELAFYKGHFKDFPITPGVILIETMAQIGLVCLGIHLLRDQKGKEMQVAFTSSDVEFLKPVLPGEKVTVKSTKTYFRFNKLKCDVELFNESGDIACRGTLAGMIKMSGNG